MNVQEEPTQIDWARVCVYIGILLIALAYWLHKDKLGYLGMMLASGPVIYRFIEDNFLGGSDEWE